jgi:hypothetical protein
MQNSLPLMMTKANKIQQKIKHPMAIPCGSFSILMPLKKE